jgi:hypothetical protein
VESISNSGMSAAPGPSIPKTPLEDDDSTAIQADRDMRTRASIRRLKAQLAELENQVNINDGSLTVDPTSTAEVPIATEEEFILLQKEQSWYKRLWLDQFPDSLSIGQIVFIIMTAIILAVILGLSISAVLATHGISP